ncbi:GGDEF domain-containing protein [Evansella cellulosilytica]|uniref:Diguanylate cyclase n=1 Tax=Evansella cellulosilytica (strain ATCC 21833 / DSM 2522 / FERM P-1141 / JCM 9156 / N-4) TaxID=649639 RepID=E6TQG9_EVAC2|nr:GGDEF domain-containing protein [Evansella cellulosilytica]ADU29347.1 diguanylate cyclase [Evansella cellulosilytica DSM 2522]
MGVHGSIDRIKQIDYITNIFMVVAFFIHFFWAFLFFWLDIPLLGYVNIVSSFVYVCGYYLVKRGHTLVALYIGHIEIVVHTSIAIYLLGIGAGFQYYIVHAIILTFIALKPSTLVKSMIVFIDMVILIILSLHSRAPSIEIEVVYIDGLLLMNTVFVCITLAVLTYLYRKVTDTTEKYLINLNKQLEIAANTDSLTNLFNRRSIIVNLKEAEADFEQKQKPFTIILADIDNFKQINDSFGHDCGDMVLKECANFLKEFFRGHPVARWGGEEFLILLQDTQIAEAHHVLEKLRQRFEEDITFSYHDKPFKISMTYGLTEYDEAKVDVLDCIKDADKALIEGKNQGKNCIVLSRT